MYTPVDRSTDEVSLHDPIMTQPSTQEPVADIPMQTMTSGFVFFLFNLIYLFCKLCAGFTYTETICFCIAKLSAVTLRFCFKSFHDKEDHL